MKDYSLFYIYHIPGVKVGCTKNLQGRKILESNLSNNKDYLREYTILEKFYGSPEQAGNLEWQWADKLGYPRGPHYKTTMKSWSQRGKIGGKKSAEVNKKQSTGLYDENIRKLGNRAAVESQKKNKTGLHNKEVWLKTREGKKYLETMKKNNKGLYNAEFKNNMNKLRIDSQRKNKTGFFSKENQLKLEEKRKITLNEIEICPHCKTSGKRRGMRTWHFDKCRRKDERL